MQTTHPHVGHTNDPSVFAPNENTERDCSRYDSLENLVSLIRLHFLRLCT